MDYRLATEQDLPSLAHMRYEHWLEDGVDPAQTDESVFTQSFTDWLGPKLGTTWFVWCAFDGERLVCHMYIQRIEKLPKPSAISDAYGYVTNVYTQPKYRNKSIGTELLSRVKHWALAADLEFLVLWPSDASVPFWRRSNFKGNEALQAEVRPYIN